MSIGYVAQKFPQLTLTFVYRELAALRAAGLHLETFSIWKPALAELSEESKELVEDTFYIFPLNWPQFFLSHLWYLFSRPHRYLGTLWFCLARQHKTLQNKVRTLLHFGQAVYMAREVERRKVKHLHAHFALNATTVAMVIARLTGISFSFTAHANDIFANPILLPEKIKAARFIVAISEYNIRFMHNLAPEPENLAKMHLVHCGIDVRNFAPPEHKAEDKRPVIAGVGRLVEKKGYSYLIKACRILADQGYDFECLIIGGGPQAALLQQMVQELNLSQHIQLVGAVFQEQLRDYLNRADIFVLPCIVGQDQDMDGIPNTLMEAMAMEIPCISTTISGIPELIVDGKSGLLAPPQDEAALARAIARLLEDRELRSSLGKAGRATVMAEFEIEKNAATLLTIFKSYLGDEAITTTQGGPQNKPIALNYMR